VVDRVRSGGFYRAGSGVVTEGEQVSGARTARRALPKLCADRSGRQRLAGLGLPGGGRMGLVLVVLLLIPGRKAPERADWHRVRARTVDRLVHPGDGGFIPAMAAENSLLGVAPADPGDP
jgi:hypothetical protein